MNNNTFIFRVDASENIGLGHLSRCLLIANYIKDKGYNVAFITEQSLSQNIIESKGFKCHRVYETIPNIKKLYSSFSVIADINSDVIFGNKTDYYSYLSKLGAKARSLVTFEDLINYPYCSDVVIIPYCGAEKLKLNHDCNSRYLLGHNFFPLRKEFNNDCFYVSKNAKKILITMGGSDPEKITLKVLSAINSSDQHYEIIVVLGQASNISPNDINKTMHNYKGLLKIFTDAKEISKLMLDCDVAITNSGLTKYELASLGVPTIVISNNEQQALYSDFFSSFKSSIHLGNFNIITEKLIRDNCVNLMQGYNLRLSMSERGKKLLDGKGINRIWQAILEK